MRHVPTSVLPMNMSRSCAVKSQRESGLQVMPCGVFPTGKRVISFISSGSMTETWLLERCATATYLPLGETETLCGQPPWGIFFTTSNPLAAVPSRTQTSPVPPE